MEAAAAVESSVLTRIQILLQERLMGPVQVLPYPNQADGGYDAILHLDFDGGPRELRVRVKTGAGSAIVNSFASRVHSGAGRNHEWLLAAPDLTARVRAELRKRGLNHVDLAGNVFIRAPGLYLWLDADRKPPPQRSWTARPLNPFSKKASLVLRALLEAPKKAWGVRQLATETRLSVGHASDVTKELVRRRYARDDGHGISLEDGVAALRDWLGAYDWTMNGMSSFVVPFEYDEVGAKLACTMDAAGIRFALTLLSGADRVAGHVQHDQTHLYVSAGDAERARELVQESLYGEPVAAGGNLHVMMPYYRDGVFYGSRPLETTRIVSPVQLFIDLANFPLRGAEAARMLALGPLARQLGLASQQVQELARTVE